MGWEKDLRQEKVKISSKLHYIKYHSISSFLNGEKDFHFILDTMSLMEEEFNGQWTWFESEYSSDNSQKKKKNLIFEESNSSGSEIFDLTGVNVRHLTKKLQIDQKLL